MQGLDVQVGADGDVHLAQINIGDLDTDTLLAESLISSEVRSIGGRTPYDARFTSLIADVLQSLFCIAAPLRCCLSISLMALSECMW